MADDDRVLHNASGIKPTMAVEDGTDDVKFLKVNAGGELLTSTTISGDVNVDETNMATSGLVGKPAAGGGDFDVVWTSATQLTCSNFPTWYANLTVEDILVIQQIATGGAVTATYSRDDAVMTVAANVIAVTGAAFVNTDTFVVYTNVNSTNYHLEQILVETAGTHTAIDKGVSIPVVTHRSPVDFTAAFTTSITITLAGLPIVITDASQISYIKQILAANSSNLWINGFNCTITHAGGVLTIYDAGTPFVTADVYEVGINEQDKAHDATLDITKTIDQSPAKDWYTDPVAYTTFTPTTVAYVEGTVIDTRTYHTLNFAFTKTVSTADNSYIRVVYLSTSGSATDYQEISLGNPVAGVMQVSKNVYEIDLAVDTGSIISFPTKGYPFMRIDIAKVTDAGTDAVFTTEVNKVWGN